MSQSRELVERYMRAYYSGDLQAARAFLARGLSYTGPGVHFESADAFIRGSGHAATALRGHEIEKIFVDGDDVCVFFDALLDHAVARMKMVDWYHLDGGSIVSIRTLFDTAPFRPQASVANEESAIDPVCSMTVVKATAAATRSYRGARYYFCSPGCAAGFDAHPERYVEEL